MKREIRLISHPWHRTRETVAMAVWGKALLTWASRFGQNAALTMGGGYPMFHAPRLALVAGLTMFGGVLTAGEPPTDAPIRADAEFPIRPSDRNQRMPDVAFAPGAAGGDGVFLVVWQEGWNGVGGNADIHGALLSESASEPTRFLTICAAPDHQEAPRVVFGGGVFLVVWHDFRHGKDADILGARVTPRGEVQDPDGLPIAVRPRNQNFPVAGTDGKDFLVIWREVRSGQTYDLAGSRVASATGKVLDEKGHLFATDGALPSVGFAGSRYVVGWLNADRRKNLHFCRYDPATLAREEAEPATAGHPDAFGNTGQMKFISGAGEVMALWARGARPDPWGWGGPGAMLSMRIRADGTTPEAGEFNRLRWSPEGREPYTKRLLPGVLDTAHWKGFEDRWPQGKPGGFKEAENGFWPHAYLAATPLAGRPGEYLAVWVRAHLEGLKQTGRFDILGGRLRSAESVRAPDFPPVTVAAGGCVSLPAVCAGGERKPVLLVYEEFGEDGKPAVKGRWVHVEAFP